VKDDVSPNRNDENLPFYITSKAIWKGKGQHSAGANRNNASVSTYEMTECLNPEAYKLTLCLLLTPTHTHLKEQFTLQQACYYKHAKFYKI
jgi:hypothetical protein